jgi:hypothetical protein
MWYSNLEKTFISRHILHQHWYTRPISLPVRRNTEVIWHCRLSHFRISVSTSSSSAKHLSPSYEPLYATNTSHHKEETFLYEYPLQWVLFPQKKCTIERCSSSTITILTTETSLWTWCMPVCYLVIHIENLLHPLQLFYFHLWPIY